MELKQFYQRVSGSISSPGDRKGIRKGKLKGPILTFSLGNKAQQRYQGTVSEEGIKGVIKTRSGGLIPWEASKIEPEERTALAKLSTPLNKKIKNGLTMTQDSCFLMNSFKQKS